MRRRVAIRVRRQRQRGFTLIEFLIAISISSFVLASLATAMHMLSSSWTANNERLLHQDMILRGLAVVSRDIHGMLRLRLDAPRQAGGAARTADGEKDKKRGERFAFAGSPTTMELVVVEPPYPTRPGLFFVRYRVVPERNGFALLRERAPYRPGMQNLQKLDYGDGVILLEGRYRFAFSYAAEGSDGLIWSDNWSEPKDMPKLVRLAVASLDTGQPVMAPFSVRPRIDAEHDCLAPKSQKCSVSAPDSGADVATDAADGTGKDNIGGAGPDNATGAMQ